MARKDWYTVKDAGDQGYAVLKLDEDFRHTETYHVTRRPDVACTCFAGNKSTCRHRQIVQMYISNNLVGSGRLYNFDKTKFYDPPAMEV